MICTNKSYYGGYGIHKYVKCPTCNNRVTIYSEFIEDEDIFTSFGKWLKKHFRKNKGYKENSSEGSDKEGTDDNKNSEKKTIVFDFDGVIHRYSKGWQDGSIYDIPVDGIKEVIDKLRETYKIVVVSTRTKTKKGRNEVLAWLDEYNIEIDDIMAEKPPAIIYVDDRGINFNGDCKKLLKNIKKFRPWTEKFKEN